MADILNYKCPNCTAALTFDPKTQRLVCDYCGSSYSIEEVQAMQEDKLPPESEKDENQSAAATETAAAVEEEWNPEDWQTGDMEGMKVLSCPNCGAEVIVEKATGAVKCPYCDNAMVIPKEFSGMYQPDYVIPFKKTKEEAIAAMKNLYLKRPLLPAVFKNQNHMEEVKAVYVPFWLFDLEADGDFEYEGTTTRTWEDSNYRYVETSYYDVERTGTMKFVKIPVDGSEKIDDTMMEAIEPYDYSEIRPFDITYLSGYMANKYDVEAETLRKRIEERMNQSVRHYFTDSVNGYSSLRPRRENIRITKRNKVKYGLFPVWFLTTEWNGKRYAFTMNGQTGKMVSNLPIGKDLVVSYWFRHHIPFTLIMAGAMIALRFMGVI